MAGSSVGAGGIYNQVNFNLYHYANNNPVKYTDPNGEWAHIAVGAAIGAGVGAISAWASGASGREIVAAAVGGAVTGGMAAATCGMSLGATIAGSAMAGTAGYLAENIVAGKQATVEGTIMSGASGAAGAMAGAIVEKAVGMVSTAVSQAVKSVKTSGETAYTKIGRQAHTDYNPGPEYKKEFSLPNGKRADAVDLKNGIVRELKPNNPRAIKLGEKQVQGYIDELQKHYPNKNWKGYVDTYER